MLHALLELQGASRQFMQGEVAVDALHPLDLTIHAGTLVAIMGASGSGKSTLLNLLGCLDQPSSGTYRIRGQATAGLATDQLARLRLTTFGFIFQRYHLLPHLSARENVELPGAYMGLAALRRRRRARELLARMGLADRENHLPGQLSGGQQQRVSVARALMNGGSVLLADEPTGALDSAAGDDLMALLLSLQAQGHTIVVVTHDARVAACAERIIELHNGRIISDRPNQRPVEVSGALPRVRSLRPVPLGSLERLAEALQAAWPALHAHSLRTALTMLGMVIGVASVVGVLALGAGAQQHIRETVGALAGRQIDVRRGETWGDPAASGIQTIRSLDVQALQEQSYVDAVTPLTEGSFTIRRGAQAASATVSGAGVDFLRVRGVLLGIGRSFLPEDVRSAAQVAIIDPQAQAQLFRRGESPLGQTVLVANVPFTVIGVTDARSIDQMSSRGANVVVPSSTAANSLFGRPWFDSLLVRLREGQSGQLAETAITRMLTITHGRRDFFTQNRDTLARALESNARTTALTLSLIGTVSLLVGGIGVMNIMLVSVSERTREVGIRMALGARQSDILQQFLIEAILVCLAGGALGVALAYGSGPLFARYVQEWHMIFMPSSVLMAFGVASLTGILFGFLPAWKASRLLPVAALARE